MSTRPAATLGAACRSILEQLRLVCLTHHARSQSATVAACAMGCAWACYDLNITNPAVPVLFVVLDTIFRYSVPNTSSGSE